MSESFVVSRDGCQLAGERWPGGSPLVVLLHEGVADRRGWREMASQLAPALTVIAYDRRGFGETPPATGPFSHAEDLLAVLDEVAAGPVWLAGASAGGGLALDTTLLAPARVSGLVLSGTAVSGAPEPELDAATQRFDKLIDQAIAAGDGAERNRLETWLWLDGPAQPEGRVTGAARSLALDMNEIVVRNGVPESAGASGVDAWHRLPEVQVPVTVACGDLDVPFVLARCRELADRLPDGRFQLLPGMAHQPYLEQPEFVANLVRDAVTSA
ncbi:MAG: alpha/beta hydrolase [Actinobacteria bacterium]|nr:alpha/beta hydrolase [Actinomycetota bacterium]